MHALIIAAALSTAGPLPAALLEAIVPAHTAVIGEGFETLLVPRPTLGEPNLVETDRKTRLDRRALQID